MKAFISSLISGMSDFRDAAREAVETARFTPVMAEDFGALPTTPQIACLNGLRQSDVVVLVLGDRYGAEQPSGLSATHEEWRDAQNRKPVLVFVQEGVDREPKQMAFVEEVEAWAAGRFRAGFQTPRDLRVAIGRALGDYERANAVGPIDEAEMTARALTLLPPTQRNMSSGEPILSLTVAGGPKQQILRPAEVEDRVLWEAMHQAAMFGETRVFDQSKGVQKGLEGAALLLAQERGSHIRLDEQGDLLIASTLPRSNPRSGLSAIIDEEVHQTLASALTYAAWVLERIDPTQRLTHVAIAARIVGDRAPWSGVASRSPSP